ncbi:MAG: hypothetical protein LIP05_11530 [Tannerellaceae bacterium]|nr:hypothetical protein [Tannerellaceae bacterium]
MKKYIRCLWIVHTLMEEGDASLADLNERWRRSSYGYEGGGDNSPDLCQG